MFYAKNKETPKDELISVVVPVYNASDYLPKCLDSLLTQTYNNIEIICVNDGSKDNSLDILNEYKEKDSRIAVIDKENGGVASARNAGINASNGEYVSFIDPDDYIDLDTYEKCLNRIHKTKADILVFDFISEPSGEKVSELPDKTFYDSFKALHDYNVGTGSACNKIFKRSILTDNNIWFYENLRYGEDNLFVNMVFPKAKIVTTLPGVFYHWVRIPNSSGNSVPQKRRFDDAISRCNYLIDYYVKEGYLDQYDYLLDYCICTLYYRIKDDADSMEMRKYYSSQIIDIIDNRILNNIDKISDGLNAQIDELRKYANS